MKIIKFLCACLILITITACGKTGAEPTETITEVEGEENTMTNVTAEIELKKPAYGKKGEDDFFAGGEIAKKVYVWRKSENFGEITLVEALQGLTAKTEAAIYINAGGAYDVWLKMAKERLGFETAFVFDPWELIDIFGGAIADSGYVLYQYGDESVNVAATICGVTGWLPVSNLDEEKAAAKGLIKKADAREVKSVKALLAEYGGFINTRAFLNQQTSNPALRDFGIKNQCLITYTKDTASVLNFLETNAVLLGWHNDEVSGVAAFSKKQVATIASDHAYNLSFLSSLPRENFKTQVPFDDGLKAESGKHYVAFVYSDGDNIQWVVGGAPMDAYRFAHDKSAEIPFGWSMAPTLADFSPVSLEYLYENAAATDYFVQGVSGFGYVHPSEYVKAGNIDALYEFGKLTAQYAEKSGMPYTEILDEYATNPSAAVLDAFLSNDALKGVLYKCGDRYVGGGKGFLKWSNDKPVLAFRESLWSFNDEQARTDVYEMAYRVSLYDKNPETADGYTLINVHAWSHGYESVETMVKWWREHDPNIVVVTPATLMKLVSENVPRKDAKPKMNFDDKYDYPSDLY